MKTDKYIRRVKTPLVVTSINIEPKHIKFIRERRLNLSLMVRDLIDGLMSEQKGEGR